jgi:hypothetical protein
MSSPKMTKIFGRRPTGCCCAYAMYLSSARQLPEALGDAWEQREQGVVGYASCVGEYTVIRDAVVHA